MNFTGDYDFAEKTQSFSLGSPIHYNSKINLTYSPSQDITSIASPKSAFASSSEQMSKQLIEAISQEKTLFTKRCEDMKKELASLLRQFE